ncbi:MAG: hypothetical protein AAFU50_07515, partial [Pseudomonadota bacterium]
EGTVRWATIESLASRFASRPIASLDAPVRAAIVGGGLLVGLIPAIRAYRMSVADGMTVRA